MEEFELSVLHEKMRNGYLLSGDEIGFLLDYDRPVGDVEYVLEQKSGESRWLIHYNSYYLFKGDPVYYGIYYSRGKTECREDEYPEQIATLNKKVVKTIEVDKFYLI